MALCAVETVLMLEEEYGQADWLSESLISDTQQTRFSLIQSPDYIVGTVTKVSFLIEFR